MNPKAALSRAGWLILTLCCCVSSTQAHERSQVKSRLVVDDAGGVAITIDLATPDVAELLGLPEDANLVALGARFDERLPGALAKWIDVRGDGRDCPRRLRRWRALELEGVRLEGTATCASPVRLRLHWTAGSLTRLKLSNVAEVVGAEAPCNSSLECAGKLFCLAVGPNRSGACWPAVEAGGPCGASVDPLAAAIRDVDVNKAHPPCQGYCRVRHCADHAEAGQPCAAERRCRAGFSCTEGRCAKTQRAALDEACNAKRRCTTGACVDGRCRLQKSVGQPCSRSADCRGVCGKEVKGARTCEPRCEAAGPWTTESKPR